MVTPSSLNFQFLSAYDTQWLERIGWAAMDKALEGRLEQVLGELTDHVWSPAA